jgi:hypothetical protein
MTMKNQSPRLGYRGRSVANQSMRIGHEIRNVAGILNRRRNWLR